MNKLILTLIVGIPLFSMGQKKFAQLGEELPTPNQYRNAAGAPGHGYYQQKADHKIKVTTHFEFFEHFLLKLKVLIF